MITDKRLQEIKNMVVKGVSWWPSDKLVHHTAYETAINELIAAVEQSQEKLTSARRYLEYANTGRGIFLERIAALRKQLEECLDG